MTPGPPRSPSWQVRCFGGFALLIDGEPFALAGVKPRSLQLLHLLAIQAGRPVHREVLTEALWPNASREAASRCLHVAVSSLRHALQSAQGSPAKGIERSGDAYRLELPVDARHDIVEFERWSTAARVERDRGDVERAVPALTKVLDVHRGDLLPEDGPAEWVSGERERYRARAAEAANELACGLLGLGDVVEAARQCHRGLRLDRYNDRLWRMLIDLHDRAGNAAAAALARRRYEDVLDELGVAPAPA